MPDDRINPYQAPLAEASACSEAFGPNEATIKFVRRFRHGVHALGCLWFVIGVIKAGSCIAVVEILMAHDLWIRQGQIIAIAVVALWFLLSALTLAKQAWAMAAGLWLCGRPRSPRWRPPSCEAGRAGPCWSGPRSSCRRRSCKARACCAGRVSCNSPASP